MNAPLPLDPEAAVLALGLGFAASEGGPLIAMSESALADWQGTDTDDYDRACDASFGLIDVGASRALALDNPDSGAFVARPYGALIVRWVGGDDAAMLLTAAFAIPDESYEDVEGLLPHDGGRLVMFDAAERGPEHLAAASVTIELPAGRYGVRVCPLWEGPVAGVDGNSHDVIVQTIQLRKR
ncbi:MAG: hypothetical protein H0T46_14845 [Deltaproteobacteria bacterium]|nr:hypothetical protein [Deltaproteobacteria bacterium]